MAPYRSREEPRAPKVAPTTGLVADMVRQFADTHAFVRELVQNGIDAGATSIEVAVDRSADGTGSVRVTDDGCGMTMEIVEDALLVLFRSTKDSDATKIGKYGVGFMSVFAIEPAEVTVDTWRDGGTLRVRLFPDHSYEIENAMPRDGSGTTVTLSRSVSTDKFDDFWQKVAASLHRWCRHAELPIHFTVSDFASNAPVRTARADQPFEVRSVVSVRKKYDDMEIVLGPIAGSAELPSAGSREDDPSSFAGFYNRGLTLHETVEPVAAALSNLRVKVKSSRLLHTLSRDDVRRDQAFHLALGRAQQLASVELRAAVLADLEKEAAAATASGASSQRLAQLLEIATLPPLSFGAAEIRLPLAHAVSGASTLSVERARAMASSKLALHATAVLATTLRNELTEALAGLGIPVILADRQAAAAAVGQASGYKLAATPVTDECLLVRELSSTEKLSTDDALCAGLGAALAPAGIDRVAIGRLSGPDGRIAAPSEGGAEEQDGRLGAFVPKPVMGAREHVVTVPEARITTSSWPKGALLVLCAGAEPVRAARHATSPIIAAHLLARYLLLLGPGLSSKRSEALATAALAEIQ